MKQKLYPLLSILVLSVLLCGCRLATEEGNRQMAGDTFIGLYITTEYVDTFDWENLDARELMNGHLSGKGENRLYGTLDTEGGFVTFPGLEGYAFLQLTLTEENGEQTDTGTIDSSYAGNFVSDVLYELHFSISDSETSCSATISYDSAKAPDGISFYSNPVYLTPEGDVYLESGMGLNGQPPGESSTTVSRSASFTQNGETASATTSFTLNIKPVLPTETLTFSQMDADGSLLQSDTCTVGELPEEIFRLPGTAYTLVTHADTQGNILYEVLNKEDTQYTVYECPEGLIVVPHYITIH